MEHDTKHWVTELTKRGIVPRSIAQTLDVSPQAVYQQLTNLNLEPAQGTPATFNQIIQLRLEVGTTTIRDLEAAS